MITTSKATTRTAVVGLATALLLAACASDGPRGKRGGGRGGDRGESTQTFGQMDGADFNALYRRTLAQKEDQGCQATLPPLQILARQGPGYEGAQLALAECLLEIAQKDSTTDHLEALLWLRRAAEGGRAEAQGALAFVYLNGPDSMQDHKQALFWYALYLNSASRHHVSFTPMDPGTEAQLATAFDETTLSSVSAEVAAWQPMPWIPPKEMNMNAPPRDQNERGASRIRRQTAEVAS